jgi:hypothetical protein
MTDEPLIATKDRLGEYDAIETAKEGEPLFPLQGGDPFAPPTVNHWAALARAEGVRLTGEHAEGTPEHKRGLKLLEKATDAEAVAWAMQDYQRGVAAAPAPSPATYTGYVEAELDEAGNHDRAVRAARIKGAERLNNLVAQGTEIAEALKGLDACIWEADSLLIAIGMIKDAAATIEPRRDQERS